MSRLKLEIPAAIEIYNKNHAQEEGFVMADALAQIPEEKRPVACVGCKSCEQVCPQQIQIASIMKQLQ